MYFTMEHQGKKSKKILFDSLQVSFIFYINQINNSL
jgi:hypothetical protein